MSAMEDLLCGHIRGCREAVAEATSRIDALEALVEKLSSAPPQPLTRYRTASWSDDEDAVLIASYEALGPKGCATLIPHRTELAIRTRAHRLGLAHLESAKRSWCDQCDAKVTSGQVASCKSKFCPGKARG
jgi:hypothetical protein